MSDVIGAFPETVEHFILRLSSGKGCCVVLFETETFLLPLNGHNPENIKESRVESHIEELGKGGDLFTRMHIKKYFITNSNKEHVKVKAIKQNSR